jgi:hypothetical protein
LPTGSEESFTIKQASTNPFKTNITVVASFPIPDTVTRAGSAPNPYFSFSLPDGETTFQWQVHPVQHGPLRYTLAAIDPYPAMAQDAGTQMQRNEENILAIYHHIGLATSLSMPYSEGVLLLPELRDNQDSSLEAVYVASLLGLLWCVRRMPIKKRKASQGKEKQRDLIIPQTKGGSKKSFFARVFRRS